MLVIKNKAKMVESGQNQAVRAAIKNEQNKKWDRIFTYAIISAENPFGEKTSREANRKSMKALRDYAKEMHLYYVNLIGKYGNKEHSLMLLNLNLAEAEFLGEEFKQESFFFAKKVGDKFEVTYYQQFKNKAGNFTGDFKPLETTTEINIFDEKQPNFYSARHNTQFTIPMSVFENLNYKEELDEQIFTDSYSNDKTIKSNINNRLHLIKDLNVELNEIKEDEN